MRELLRNLISSHMRNVRLSLSYQGCGFSDAKSQVACIPASGKGKGKDKGIL